MRKRKGLIRSEMHQTLDTEDNSEERNILVRTKVT